MYPRKRLGSDNYDGDELRESKRARSSLSVNETWSESRRLACPFFLRYPNHFGLSKACTGSGFITISRLKEHLYRSHRKTHQASCPRCQSNFDDEKSLATHLKEQQRCGIVERGVDYIHVEVISEDVIRQLRSRKSNSQTRSDRERWNEVWHIIFPGQTTPNSPCKSADAYTCIPTNLDRHAQPFPTNSGWKY